MPFSTPRSPSLSSLLAILLVLPFSVHAVPLNDWTKPCLQGECFYDLPASNTEASGSIKIWGSADAISDVTTAAGWTILSCSPNVLTQDIRLVCNSDNTGAAGCDHLYQNIGAVGKLVRLPENCGKSAFARVAKAWVPEDQSIPEDIAHRLVRRQGVQPEVKALALDTNFAAVDPATAGEVFITIQGSTVPGEQGNLTVTPPTFRRRHGVVTRRGFFDSIGDALSKFSSFDKDITQALPPVDFSKEFPLFSQSVSCAGSPSNEASAKASVVTTGHAVITLGVAAAGTVVPPKLSEFGVFTGMDAKIDGTLNLVGNVEGKADSGQLTIFETGIPGLDFPGILTVGPSFKVLAQATATLDINVDTTVDLSYTVTDAKLFFPPGSNQQSGGSFSPGTAPLKLSVSPSVSSTATVAAHLIPRVDLGISALGGTAEATIFLDLDSSASLTLTLNADASASASVESTTGDVTTDTSAEVNGCVKADVALNVNAGADGSFFDIFDKSTTIPLFTKDFEIFQKCFGAQKRDTIPIVLPRRRANGPKRHARSMYRRQSLQLSCPAIVAAASKLVTLA